MPVVLLDRKREFLDGWRRFELTVSFDRINAYSDAPAWRRMSVSTGSGRHLLKPADYRR
jgi:hypothetical protein